MELKLIFGIIAVALGLASFFPYVRDIFLKKTTPHIYSWLVWSILQTIGVIAMIGGNAGYGSFGLAMGGLVSVSVFLLSFKYGTKNITIFDTICLVGALIAVMVYFFQKDPLLAVILITVIDFIGFLPTYRKGYMEPQSETVTLYLLSAISNAFALVAIIDYSMTTVLYVGSLVITNGIIVAILLGRRILIKV